jgi:dTDP-glucose 4,6-dehydratase
MVDGILLCLTNDRAVGHVFNIGNPRGTITVLSLAEKIVRISNSQSKITFVPKSYVDVELRIPDIEKSKEILGFKPRINLDTGIRRTLEWYAVKSKE